MRVWIALLLTAEVHAYTSNSSIYHFTLANLQLATAWKSPFMRINNHKKVQLDVQNEDGPDLTKKELELISKSLEPKSDGPILRLLPPGN
jgi:hypothetical protein